LTWTPASLYTKGEEKANKGGVMPWSHEIRVGPAGWSYQDWKHIVYPDARPRKFHEAAYLAQYFDVIEINTSFYRPLRPELAHLWVRKTAFNPRFQFTAKLFRAFTHEGRLDAAEIRQYQEGLRPILEAGRLGVVLMQFPWSFRFNRENRDYLVTLKKTFPDYPLVAEMRHDSWLVEEALGVLIDHHIGFCNIDQPVLSHCLPPTALVTTPVGYVRLHGRNYASWFEKDAEVAARYNYLYSEAELIPWADRIQQVASQARTTYVITNNHFEGKAVVNGLQLINLLLGEPVQVPPDLFGAYPELAKIAGNAPAQGSLFENNPTGKAAVASEYGKEQGTVWTRSAAASS
jgi:uncharacterized protein YecE (DUF72 family)